MKNILIITSIMYISLFNACNEESTTADEQNHPPQIISLVSNPDTVGVNGTCVLSCNANDPDGDNLSYTWEASAGVLNGTGTVVTWTAPNSFGTYSVSCKVSDGQGGQDIESINIVVNSLNTAPNIISLSANPDTIFVNQSSMLTCIANDAENDPLIYNWQALSGSINGTGATVNWNAPSLAGTYNIICQVDDGNGGVDSASINILVKEDQFPTAGLVEYYPFDGNANDESGNGQHGTIYGNTLQFVPGIFDQAIKFDNHNSGTFTVNDYVELPNITINELTVSHWVKFLSGSSTSYDGCTYSIGIFPSKQLLIGVKNAGTVYGTVIFNGTWHSTSTVDLSDNQWHLITATVDNDYIRIYLDGSKIDSTSIPSAPGFTNAYQYVALHRFNNDRSSRFTGELDDLYIFNRALSDYEILQIYNKR